jgi:nitrite reductase/ring-hydroxylating ferredoxin subunit
MRGITRYIEDLVRSRRPRRFRASEEDTGLARVAIMLRTARPGSGAPAEDFVTALHKKLAAEFDPPAPRRALGARRALRTRRALLRAAAVVGATAAGAGIDHGLTSRIGARDSSATADTLTPSHGTWLTVAVSSDLPEGAVRGFTADAVTGFIQRADGRLRAVSGICTHQGCRLTLAADPARLVCPCHRATFGLNGAVLAHKLPLTLTALPRLAVRETGGAVQIYAPARPTPHRSQTS